MNLTEMRAERDRLDAEIAATEKQGRENWNSALNRCEDALIEWLHGHSVEYGSHERKNATTWDVGHGALTVTFVADDGQYGPGALRMTSGQTLTLDWSEVPEPARMLAIVAVLLGKTSDDHR